MRREYAAVMHDDVVCGLEARHGIARALFGLRCAADAVVTGYSERALIVWRDIVSGLRNARGSPFFSAVVLVMVCLTVAVSSTVGSMLWGVFVRPLPYVDAAALVQVWEDDRRLGVTTLSFSPRDAAAVRARSRLLETGWLATTQGTLVNGGRARALSGEQVGGDFMRVLRVRPSAGRLIEASDATAAADRIVISDELWRSEFGADPAIVGRSIRINGAPSTVVGVALPFAELNGWRGGLAQSDYWVPLRPGRSDPEGHTLLVVARLKPGATVREADAELAAIVRGAHHDKPGERDVSAHAVPASDVIRAPLRGYGAVASAAVVTIVVLAFANLAILFSSRASSRTGELALRVAVGATRRRLVSQLLFETGLLFAAGAALGLVAAHLLIDDFKTLLHALPRMDAVRLDGVSVLIALAVAAAGTAIAAKLSLIAPGDLRPALKAWGHRAEAPHGRRLRDTLAVLEIALAVSIAAVAASAWYGLNALTHQPLGFDPSRLYLVRVANVAEERYASAARRGAFLDEVRSGVNRSPRIAGAEWSSIAPFGNYPDVAVRLPRAAIAGPATSAKFGTITPGYFRLLGISVTHGRAFGAADRDRAAPVAVVNEAFARARFGRPRDALGQSVVLEVPRQFGLPVPRRIVGVVGDVRPRYGDPFPPTVYVPVAQLVLGFEALLVKVRDEPADVAALTQRAVERVGGPAPLPAAIAYDRLMQYAVEEARIVAELLAVLAASAVVLAVGGVYAVVSFTTAQRTHEFGVRLAVGALRRDILAIVVAMALRFAAIGVVLGGVVAAAALAFAPPELLPAPAPLWLYGAVVAAFAGAALGAALLPAARAVAIEPAAALRYE